MKIAIVGAGIIGVTTAIAIQEALPEYRLTIVADVWTPGTTGDGSAGLWGPFALGSDTPLADFMRWGGLTHRWFEKFWNSELAAETGVSLMPVTRVSRQDGWTMPEWSSIVYGASQLTEKELKQLREEHGVNYKNGLQFVTYTAEPTRLLPWLIQRFKSAGGKTLNKKIDDLDELHKDGYDIVINCTGLGAQKLVNDSSVQPIRGHVIRVKAPWVFSVFIEEDKPGNYVIPNIDSVILGGTAQLGDYDLSARETDKNFILTGCHKILPALQGSEVIKNWIGLRPSRPRVRLECEYRHSTGNGIKYLVIHNYGHGGCGVTVCWGCALDVVEILKNSQKKIRKNVENSSQVSVT